MMKRYIAAVGIMAGVAALGSPLALAAPIWDAKAGDTGAGQGDLNEPAQVTLDSQGRLYIADRMNDRVDIYDGAGTYAATLGRSSSRQGDLFRPEGIAIGADDRVFVADSGNHRIQVFAANGDFLTAWGQFGVKPGQFNSPGGVTADVYGTIYIADTGNNRIQVFDENGTFVRAWGSRGSKEGQFAQPAALWADPDGKVYVTDTGNHRIQVFDSSGNFLLQFGNKGMGPDKLFNPQAIAGDGNGIIYVADANHRLRAYTSAGTYLKSWGRFGAGEDGLNLPTGLAVTPGGMAYVADPGNQRIIDFRVNSAPTASMPTWMGEGTVGQAVYAHYTYLDADGDLEGDTSYRWYRAGDAAGSNRQELAGQTLPWYVLRSEDQGSWIGFEVTPKAVTGVVYGETLRSGWMGPVDTGAAGLTAPSIQTSVTGWTYGPVAFTLSGSAALESSIRKYQYKLGAESDWVDYPGSAVTIDSEGETQLYARAQDYAGNISPQSFVVVRIYRGTPSLTILGNEAMALEAGSVYTDPGVVANDALDGNISSRIVVTGTVDTSRLGTYVLQYAVTNSVGQTATTTRTIVVQDTGKPILTLLGDNPASVPIGEAYVDGGAVAEDAWEGDVTSRITVTSDVDTSRAGTYLVRYNVADSSGNAAPEAVRTVNVSAQETDDSDHTAPTAPTIQVSAAGWTPGPVTFTLSGSTDLDSGVQKYQYKFGVGGEWTDYAGSAVVVDTEGETEVYARALDYAGNVSSEASAVIRIYRGVPSLTLLGETTMDVEAGSVYEEPGFVASDVRDGNIGSQVVMTGTVDPSRLGTYELHYSVTNAVGMSATAVRTVVVRDTEKPVITLHGDNPVVVPVGADYEDAGAAAQDAWEGELTSSIAVISDVDTNRAGTYSVRYNVTDSSGNAATEVVRTVRVVKSGATPETPETPVVTPPEAPPDSGVNEPEVPSAPLAPPAMSTVIRIPVESGATVQGELRGLLEIRIPSGGVPTGSEVRMAVSSTPSVPTSGTLTSEVFNVASSAGTQLTESMNVRIRYASEKVPAGQQPALYYYNEQQKRWIYVGGEITEAGTLQAEMNHFSPIAVIAGPPVAFEDMAGHWAEKEAKRLAGMQVVSGMEEGVYLPGAEVTRAQFVVMLSRTFNLAPETPAAFKDGEHIPAWAESHIAAAAQKGWIQGYAAGDALAFMPDQDMTRAELAVLMGRILDTYEQAAPSSSAANGYEDQAAIPGWADFAVRRMAELHLMQGYEDGKFHPERSVTRAEAAVVLYRLLEWLHM